MASAQGPSPGVEVTRLLIQWREGNRAALDLLTAEVYRELHDLAAGHIRREGRPSTMQPTSLIHEAYLRLIAQDLPDFQNRSHFFGVAANLMRQILVDHARKRRSLKRGGELERVSLDQAISFAPSRDSDLLALDQALSQLAGIDPRKARVIEMRFFGGMSVEETAEAAGVSTATVVREQRFAEAWLHSRLNPDASRS